MHNNGKVKRSSQFFKRIDFLKETKFQIIFDAMKQRLLPYSTLSSPLKRPTLSLIREGTRQRWFIFSKILHHLYQKRNWRFFFIITGSYLNRKIQKIRRSCSQKVQRYSFLQIFFCWKFFQRPRFFQFLGDRTTSNTIVYEEFLFEIELIMFTKFLKYLLSN